MLADLPRLFEDVDIFFADLRAGLRRVVLINQLRQAQRTGHTSGTTPDDDHIGGHLRPLNAFDRFAEDQHKKTSATDSRGSTRINHEKNWIRKNPRESVATKLPARLRLLYFLNQRRNDVEQIPHDRVISNLEYRSF